LRISVWVDSAKVVKDSISIWIWIWTYSGPRTAIWTPAKAASVSFFCTATATDPVVPMKASNIAVPLPVEIRPGRAEPSATGEMETTMSDSSVA
jgi:hypothetical protein